MAVLVGIVALRTVASSILTATGAVLAKEEPFGVEGVLIDEEYSLEGMLVYAIQDEYLAQTEYDMIMSEFGVNRPFSNISKAEAKHIELKFFCKAEYSTK